MMYKVIESFFDLMDNNHPYHAGDIFPREGVEVSAERFAELAGKNNKRGIPLIKKEKVKKPKKAADQPVEE
jgi:hypothetical protein